jgi:hypothetical protein
MAFVRSYIGLLLRTSKLHFITIPSVISNVLAFPLAMKVVGKQYVVRVGYADLKLYEFLAMFLVTIAVGAIISTLRPSRPESAASQRRGNAPQSTI